jgi:hypothetical protein
VTYRSSVSHIFRKCVGVRVRASDTRRRRYLVTSPSYRLSSQYSASRTRLKKLFGTRDAPWEPECSAFEALAGAKFWRAGSVLTED